MRLRLAAILCWVASGAMAQSVDTVAAAVQDWLSDQNAQGVIAVQPPDEPISVVDLGMSPDEPVELASLSKAITATCMAQLVEEGALGWRDPVADYVVGFDGISVADLITHQSGIVEDVTQQFMGVWLDDPTHRASEIVDLMRERGAPTGKVGPYAYSNDNYALAAQVIESAASQSYEDACRTRTLDPAGTVANPSDRTGAFLSWGGWASTVADYLRFHGHWYDTDQQDLRGPTASFGGSAVYGLGMLSRPMNEGRNYWHFGALCFPKRLNVGSFVVAFHNGWRVVVAYDACVEWSAMADLDRAVVSAIFVRD